MAPSTRKRKQAVDTTVGTKKAKNSSVTVTQPYQEDDALEDEQRDNQQFFEEAKGQKKRKVTMPIAKAEIQDHVEDVLAFIQEKEEGMTNLDPGDFPTISPNLESVGSLGRQSNIHNPTLQRTKDALRQFKDMVTKCQAPEKYEDSITMPTGVRWAQDKKDLESLDDQAIFTATRLISSLIVPNPSPSLKSPPDQKDEIARMAWEFFPKEISGMAKDTWGKIAQEQVKAFTHVLRSVEKK